MLIYRDTVESPIGDILIAAAADKLLALEFDAARERFDADLQHRFPDNQLTRADDPFGFSSRIRAYLSGKLTVLDDIAVDGGGTKFQQAVWRALRDIPVGRTMSYGELADTIGQPKAVRAVGAANGRNPISIVVPCHRVIGADGSLTGYGGGLERKLWLLRHEGALLA